MKVNIGKNTLGDSDKMSVSLKEYGRSTHNLSSAWRSPMGVGTLVPFMKILGLPGDTFNIDLDTQIMTHPTIGPLFGNFKFQADVFTCPIRLYNAMLHNNTLNIGLDMSKVKLPKAGMWLTNYKSGKASIMEYMGIRKQPRNSSLADRIGYFNIVPFLAYYDVFKNYYANKQEERFYVMGGSTVQNATTIVSGDFSGEVSYYANDTLVCKTETTVTITGTDLKIENIKKINNKHKVFAPDVPVCGGGLFTKEYVKEHNDEFDFVYNNLADEKSKSDYVDIINFKVSGKVDYLLKSYCDKDSVYKDILKLDTNESIVDLGAYDGDTIREFTSFTNGKYNRILALEPDAKSYKKLVKNTAKMPNLEALNMGAWNEKDTLIFAKEQSRNSHISASGVPVKVTDIDSLVDYPVTLIKMDIEGSEMKALDGAKKTIKRNLPKLYVCAYHRNEDLFALGKKILSFDKRYKLYFRHSLYIPAWESNFYAIID